MRSMVTLVKLSNGSTTAWLQCSGQRAIPIGENVILVFLFSLTALSRELHKYLQQ